MTNVEGRKPDGAPERSRKAGEGAASGVDGKLQSAFPFSARWRSSHDCCAVIGVFHGDEDIGPAFPATCSDPGWKGVRRCSFGERHIPLEGKPF